MNLNTINKDELLSHTAETLDKQESKLQELQRQRTFLVCSLIALLTASFI